MYGKQERKFTANLVPKLPFKQSYSPTKGSGLSSERSQWSLAPIIEDRHEARTSILSKRKKSMQPTPLGSIGWGVSNPNTRDKTPNRICLPATEQPHMKFWDEDATRFNMYTTGFPSSHIDEKYKVTYEQLEHMSIRRRREIIKARAHAYNQKTKLVTMWKNPGRNSDLSFSPFKTQNGYEGSNLTTRRTQD